MSIEPTPDHSKIMVEALRRVMRRVVNLAMTFGITYPALEAMLKRSYLDCAQQLERGQGKPLSDSRISLLTGVARSELRRLREAADVGQPLPRSVPVRVAMRWQAPPYIDKHGRAKALPRLASVGGEVSFEGLVAGVSTDIRAAALLAEWLEGGVVRVDSKDRVVLDRLAYNNRVNRQEQAALALAHTASDLLEGFTQSVSRPIEQRSRWLQYTFFSHLTETSVQALNERAQRLFEACEEVNHFGSQLEIKDRGNPAARHRYLLCTYRYSADMAIDPSVPVVR